MHLFYTPWIEGDIFNLDEQESKHAVRVLRLGIGDTVYLVDGKGGWYEAVIKDDHSKKCRLQIVAHTTDYHPLTYNLHIAISPTKRMERFEWFLEKATEIGISQITPLICNRSGRKQLKLERMERIIISAIKQSQKAFKPVLNQPVSIREFLNFQPAGVKGIAHCYKTHRVALSWLERSESYTLMVGPEGDFTEEEVEQAVHAGYHPFHMGESRMRTETAGVYLCTAIQLHTAKKNRPK